MPIKYLIHQHSRGTLYKWTERSHLRDLLQLDLGYINAINFKIQRVRCIEKAKWISRECQRNRNYNEWKTGVELKIRKFYSDICCERCMLIKYSVPFLKTNWKFGQYFLPSINIEIWLFGWTLYGTNTW